MQLEVSDIKHSYSKDIMSQLICIHFGVAVKDNFVGLKLSLRFSIRICNVVLYLERSLMLDESCIVCA
jgi:hypothetical protein